MKKSVFEYFEEIMRIPRESGKEEKILEYLVNFSKNNNIEYKIGKYNTIFLKKDNNSNQTIILQAHSDMVCVSTENYDFANKGIPFYIDGDYYKSKNTSLGADDGIGIAIILAILQENEDMPNIEVIITTQEETTMLGASNFDYSSIKGKTLISLDGIQEADIESSSAGMISMTLTKNINYNIGKENTYKLSIDGLKGGHSGDDINKKRCNGIKLITQMLKELKSYQIISASIGTRDNVIPSKGFISFETKHDIDYINDKIKNMKIELGNEDSSFNYKIEEINDKKVIAESQDIIKFLDEIKNGLLETYKDDNFPLISANIGKLSIEDGKTIIKYSIRSSDKVKEQILLKEVQELANKYKFECAIDASKPFFPFKEKSNIRELLAKTYKELYGVETTIKKVHACMEGGILSNNIDNLDICTIAPTIDNCHSINERVSISSTKRVYEWLKQTLIKYNKE